MRFLSVAFIFFLCIFAVSEGKKLKKDYKYGSCTRDQYRCRNEKCIKKSWYCDRSNQCGDNTDEADCIVKSGTSCPTHYPFFRCTKHNGNNYLKCIPKVWQCDGVYDCVDRSDELNCLNDVEIVGLSTASDKTMSWMKNLRKEVQGHPKWGENVFRLAVAFYLSDANFFSTKNLTGEELSYEIQSRLLSRLLRAQHDPLTASEIALVIHALLVTCNNPREFYGMNFVQDLRELVNEQVNYTNPYVLLALCNAGETMTQQDVDKLLAINRNPLHSLWAETQALSLMALSCISQKSNNSLVPNNSSFNIASSLRQLQSKNGSIESLKTTALVMQALLASGEENDDEWNMEQAMKFILKEQKPDGSFGNFLNTYYIAPLFRYKTLLNISSNHCPKSVIDDEALEDSVRSRAGKRVRIMYSLWYGDRADIARLLELRVVNNSSFFDVMKYAAAIDSRYKFEYSVIQSKPYVYSLSGVQNDPENDKFWFLHRNTRNHTVLPQLLDQSPSDIKVRDRQHFVMWYRTGHWSQQLKEEVRNAVQSFAQDQI